MPDGSLQFPLRHQSLSLALYPILHGISLRYRTDSSECQAFRSSRLSRGITRSFRMFASYAVQRSKRPTAQTSRKPCCDKWTETISECVVADVDNLSLQCRSLQNAVESAPATASSSHILTSPQPSTASSLPHPCQACTARSHASQCVPSFVAASKDDPHQTRRRCSPA